MSFQVLIKDGFEGHNGEVVTVRKGTLIYHDLRVAPVGATTFAWGITYEKLTADA